MLRSYFKIALRNILKNKGYSAINLFGLSLGIACCLVMFSYVRFEFSYDDFHPDLDRTYRVDQILPWASDEGLFGSTSPAMANTLRTTYPEVEDVMRVNTPRDSIIRFSDKPGHMISFHENRVYAADPNFFSFFGFKLKEGNAQTSLQGVNKVVISEEVAKKLFGDEPALGKLLLLGDGRTAIEVTGVTEKQPVNTHFHFDYLLSMDTNPNVKKREWSWVWMQCVTYVRLKPGSDPRALEAKMTRLGEEVIKPAFEKRGMDYEGTLNGHRDWNFFLSPMKDVHLKTGDNRLGPVGDIIYAWTFGIIGVFVLLIAAINFINLSTARGMKRAKEVGVKKTLGASRSALVYQFQTESIFLTAISTVLALFLVEILRWAIAAATGIEIPFVLWGDSLMLLLLPLVPLVIGFLAGLYPSFYLTSFRPVQVLKGKIASGFGNSAMRNGLVIVQFTISIALITGTIVVFQQLKFIGNKHLGFDRENILVINYAEKLGNHLETFRQEVETYPGVMQAGVTTEVPGGDVWEDGFRRETSDVMTPVAVVKTDEHYLKTLNFEIVSGRGFEKERPSDRNAIVLNETGARLFGWTPDQAIGQYLVYPGDGDSRHEIIGVMKDFNNQSLHDRITPVLFCKVESDIWGDFRVLAIKFKTDDINGLVRRLEKNWNKSLDDTPMSYSFLDQDLSRQYQEEKKLGGLFGIFSGLSILIAVIGLVGLVSYSAEVRKKEIGIRKVFGASTSRIMVMMNRQYVKLILMSLLIGAPFSWWAINQWLGSFAYRIEVSPVIFVAAAAAEIMLALASVAWLSFRAATLNPSQVLKED
ncbi:MAG: ABC transporter permease [Bacteroidota bacterium]